MNWEKVCLKGYRGSLYLSKRLRGKFGVIFGGCDKTGISHTTARAFWFQTKRFVGHLGFPIDTIFATFDLQVTPMLPTKFGVNWPFGSGEEAKNRFSRWWPWRPSWISDLNDLSYFWSTSHPDASYQVRSQLAFRFRSRSEKYIFKMAAMAAILDFWSEWF